MCTMVLPIAWKSGIARSTSLASPPIMIERRASIAPISPPETGASSVWNGGLFFAARSANSRVRFGEIVLMSIARRPSCAPDATPSGPKSTASTSGESTTTVTTTSERCATSRGVFATAMPSFARASARASVRLVTVTSKPALRRLRAIGAPMIPVPTTPTRSTSCRARLGPLRGLRLAASLRSFQDSLVGAKPLLARSFLVRLLVLVVMAVVLALHEDRARVAALRDEVGALLRLVHVHRRDEQVVGHVYEALAALQLVRDGLGE